MQELRANTQVIVTVGPFVDVGDGFTPQTDITLAGNEAELLKHGSTAVVDISAANWVAVASCRGYYSLTLTTAHTNTEGMLVVIVQDDSDCLPVKAEYMVLSEAAYDSKYTAKDDGFMDVNIKTIGRADTQETEADNLESACSNYSATRGLTGTAVPAVVSDGAGGLPTTTKITDARLGALTDWINDGRLDLLLDQTLADTNELQTDDIPGTLATIAGYIDTEIGTIDTVVDAILAHTGTDGVVLSAATCNKIADHIIRRTFQNACDSADGDAKSFRSLLGAIAKLVNKLSLSGVTLTITEDDDTTTLGTQNVTKDATAEPITAMDTV